VPESAIRVWLEKPYSKLKEIHRESIGMGAAKKRMPKSKSTLLF